MRPGQVIDDFLDRLLGRRRADRGPRACAQAFGRFHPHLDARVGPALLQGLRVGVGHDELDALQRLVDHVVHRVAARAAHPEDGDARLQLFPFRGHRQIECHGFARPFLVPPPACFSAGLHPRPVCITADLSRILSTTRKDVTQKGLRRRKIWGIAGPIQRHFAGYAGYCGHQLSLNHLTARRSDRAG